MIKLVFTFNENESNKVKVERSIDEDNPTDNEKVAVMKVNDTIMEALKQSKKTNKKKGK